MEDNFLKNKENNLTLVCHKLNSNDPLKMKIIDNYENPDNYFKIDKQYILGKICKQPRFDKNNKIVPHTVVGPTSLFNIDPKYLHISRVNSKIMQYFKVKQEKSKQLPKIHKVTNVEIDKIYDTIDSRIKNINVNEFMYKIPLDLQKKLKFQEVCLSKKEDSSRSNNNIIKSICKVTKKNEDQLLMNKSPETRIKNEIKEIIEHRKNHSKLGKHSWILSLRNNGEDKKNKENKRTYINIGSDLKPIWSLINENHSKMVEFVRSPLNTCYYPDIEKISKMRQFINSEINFDKLDKFSNLKFEGSKLLDEEIRMIRKMKGNKLLIKKEDELQEDEDYESSVLNTFNNKSTLRTNDTSTFNNTNY